MARNAREALDALERDFAAGRVHRRRYDRMHARYLAELQADEAGQRRRTGRRLHVLAGLAAARRAAHDAYLAAHAQLLGGIVHAARIDGATEAQITRDSGLSRMTVRKALGL